MKKPLEHLAAVENPQFEQVRSQILTCPALLGLSGKRQVHRPHNPFSKKRAVFVPIDRLTHTWQVVHCASHIAEQLGLNIELAGTGAIGHDTGHVAKGHHGERMIRAVTGKTFLHEYFSLVLLEDFWKIPLPHELAQCIALHSWSSGVMSRNDVIEECRVVATSDKLANVAWDAFESRYLFWRGGYEHLHYTWSERKALIAELDELIWAYWSDYQPFKYIPHWYEGTIEVSPKRSARWKKENRVRASYPIIKTRFDFTSFLENAVIAESSAVGRVSFSQGETARHFNTLNRWLAKNVYQHADYKPQEDDEMVGASLFLASYFPEMPTLHLLILLDDLITRRLAAEVGFVPRQAGYEDDDLSEILFDLDEHYGFSQAMLIPNLHEIDLFKKPDWVIPPPE